MAYPISFTQPGVMPLHGIIGLEWPEADAAMVMSHGVPSMPRFEPYCVDRASSSVVPPTRARNRKEQHAAAESPNHIIPTNIYINDFKFESLCYPLQQSRADRPTFGPDGGVAVSGLCTIPRICAARRRESGRPAGHRADDR